MKQMTFIFAATLLIVACTRTIETKNGTAAIVTPRSEVEGTINGGGGRGVLCIKDGKTTVETLDLYEARSYYKLDLIKAEENQDQALDLLTNLITKHFWNPDTIPMSEYQKVLKKQVIEKWINNISFLRTNQKLKFIPDSHEVVNEKGCEVVQVAAYYDESVLQVDRLYWDQMDWTSRVALLGHELVYFMDRSSGATNSIQSRKLIGQLFSTKGTRPKADGVPTIRSKYSHCSIDNKKINVGYFYAYDSKKEDRTGIELVFNYLNNQGFLFRTSAFLHDVSLQTLNERPFQGSTESDIYTDSYEFSKNSIKLIFSEDPKNFTLYLIDKASGTISDPLTVTCRQDPAN